MKKNLALLLVPIYLVSCVSNPVAQAPRETPTVNLITDNDFDFMQLTDCVEKSDNRSPADASKCVNFYEKSADSSKKTSALEAISGKTKVIEQFGQTENFGLWAMYLGTEQVNKMIRGSNANDLKPADFIPVKKIKSISLAWRTIRDIPDNKFTLSANVMLDLNRLLRGDVETSVMQDLNSKIGNSDKDKSAVKSFVKIIRSSLGLEPGYRKRALRIDSSFEAVSEVEFNIIKRNVESIGGKVTETVMSTENSRSIVVELPKGDAVVKLASEILEEANSKMPKMVSASYKDKIDFVAELHTKLALLSPFSKVNDLTIQMLVSRVLIQLGLDPAVQINIQMDMPKEHVAELYRNGIAEYLMYTRKTFAIDLDKKSTSEIPEYVVGNEAAAITYRGAALRVKITGKYAEKYAHAASIMRRKDFVTPLDNRIVQIGRDRRNFVLKDDGFLYDGITPHVIRFEDGKTKLYPISDYSYRLLGLSGQYTGELGVRRAITPQHQEHLGNNLDVVENILTNKTKPEDIEVVYNKELVDANRTGDLHLYEWQYGTLLRASLIREDPKENPYAVLAPGRGDPIADKYEGNSAYEEAFVRGTRGIKIGDVVGQYERKDLDYNQLAIQVRGSKLGDKEKKLVLANIHESRRRLHSAAREIMRPFFTRVAQLTPAELTQLRGNSKYFILEDYLKNFSKLGHESFEKAVEKMGDDHVFVHRTQSAGQTFLFGLMSQTEMRGSPYIRILTANGMIVPGLRDIYSLMQQKSERDAIVENGNIGPLVKQKIATLAKGVPRAEKTIEWLVLYIYSKKEKFIQNSEEFESLFMNHYLHAVNRASKEGVSTTADPTYLLMLKTYEEYAKFKPADQLVELFNKYKKGDNDPELEARTWLQKLAQRESKEKLPAEYYEKGWVGAFSKEFSVSMEDIVAQVGNTVNDKFTRENDGKIYVLRVPVDRVDSNYATGYDGQFEDTTRGGFGPIRAKVGLFSRPIIDKSYAGSAKTAVNLVGLTPNARAVYDLATLHLESRADFTPYLEYSPATATRHKQFLAGLTSSKKSIYTRAVDSLRTLKFDMNTVKAESDLAGFKVIMEDIFNETLKAIDTKTEPESRKELLEIMSSFYRQHSVMNSQVAAMALEAWGSIVPVRGQPAKVSKEVATRARAEVKFYRTFLGVETVAAE
jgi:hypothetical protein